MNILLIDDDPLFSMLNKRMIRTIDKEAEFYICENGADAIDYLKNCIAENIKLPDIIFLDLNMPVIDGWEFLKEYDSLRAFVDNRVMIYILSSSISPYDVSRAKEMVYVKDYLPKPVNKATLELVLSTVC